MKLLLAFIVICCFLAPALSEKLITKEFADELKKHNPKWEMIDPDKHPFKDRSFGDFKKKLMTKRPKLKPDKKDGILLQDSTALPENFDGRAEWGNCIKPIRDQGNCGSCWAFGIINHLTDRFCIRGKDIILSPQDIMECNTANDCCDGGVDVYAYQFMVSTGVVEDKYKTYDETCGSCSLLSGRTRYKCKRGTVWYSSSVDAAKKQIYNNGPIQALFDVYRDFAYYKSGVYSYTYGSFAGIHTVEVLGWGKENGVKYWLCKNSWGKYWGDNGYFKIKMGECGINDDFSTCEPAV